MEDRKSKILAHVDVGGYGLEIGPSHTPIAPRSHGFRVDILDYMSRDELIQKYSSLGIDTSMVEEVNYVWRGEHYADLIGKTKAYDWIIASHVIEHTPDLIGFLLDCDAVLKDTGIVSLAIPDMRYCFDRCRPWSGLASVIDHHVRKEKIHSPGIVAEVKMYSVCRDGQIIWPRSSFAADQFMYSTNDAEADMRSVINNNAYIDAHSWCFVPSSFRLLMHDLHLLGWLPFRELSFYPTSGVEFYMTLSRSAPGANLSRMELIKDVEREIIDRPSRVGLWSVRAYYNIRDMMLRAVRRGRRS